MDWAVGIVGEHMLIIWYSSSRKNLQGCSHKVSLSFTLDVTQKCFLYPALLLVATTLTCDLSQHYQSKEWINVEQFPLFLPTHSQWKAPARPNNILRRPPSEPDKLKMRSNGLPRTYFDAYRVRATLSEWEVLIRQKYTSMPASDTSTVTMKNSGLTEIYLDSYRVKHGTVQLKSSAPVKGQLFTLSRATKKKNSCTNVLPQALSHGAAGSVRFRDLIQQGYGQSCAR